MKTHARAAIMTVLAIAAPSAFAGKPDAHAIYANKCMICHGKEGKPVPMFANIGVKNLSDPEWQKSRTDAEILKIITNGKENTVMRSFKPELKPAEIEALVPFVRSLNKAAAQPPPAK